ncbi:alpha/beta hydrolase [Shewanella dokdonensis]|uniref:Alpha/beta fold hydrolase n=1 Tax=Shewanella dokdonensis TaxID=712036 RepID=A0ABX8DGM3_9GAMM|nr:alpha/beta fold hydrolase [Shewanella dokdonensis]MCL1074063.1 alpha/beta fold hydrolase [Shewanella dokdonensis]QVK23803.1 alpha/beta fold hydrolase [Shewanella dokdonensis]
MKVLLLPPLLALLTGCASYVASQIAEPQRHPAIINAPADFYSAMQLQQHYDCQSPCIHYVSGAPWPQSAQSTELQDSVFGGRTEITASDFQVQGTVVLLHGYGDNWSWMTPWSFYFQSRGFHTLMPDLPGQAGTTVADFSFGARDVNYLEPWFNQLPTTRPLIVLGHSMGAISATYLAKAIAADALVLLAPSSPLAQAAPSAAKAFDPFLSLLVPDASINAGTQQALKQLRIKDVDTDLRVMLNGWDKPTLVVSAQQDEVISQSWAAQLHSLQMQQYQQQGNHTAVLKPHQQEQQLMDRWLKTVLQLLGSTPAVQ